MAGAFFRTLKKSARQTGYMSNVLNLAGFFAAAMRRKGITVDELADETGIAKEQIVGLIDGTKEFDRSIIQKLQPVFPNTANVFRRLAIRERGDTGIGARE